MPEFDLATARILIADDNESNREYLSELLRAHGYMVVCAEDGKQALEAVQAQPIDLALLDVLMPQMDGFTVCCALKAEAETRLIPVVLVTGLMGREERIRGIESGANDFLSKPLNKEELLARVGSLVRLKRYTDELENAESVLYSLARSIEAKDPYTEGHCDRLSRYAVALAERRGLPAEQRSALRCAGVVHDIGKVAVPEHILLKPAKLTPEETLLMQTHSIVGEHICAPLKSFRNVLPIIRHHHERQDGSGYPDGLKGDEVPLPVRILQTVDVYDALTTDRPYRKALQQREAFTVMESEVQRGWWDRELVAEWKSAVSLIESLVV
jgi:putative two-component system response regulator